MSVYVRARHLRVGELIATSGQLSSSSTIGRATIIAIEPLPVDEKGLEWIDFTFQNDPPIGGPWQRLILADAVVLLAPDEEIRG